MTDLYSCCVPKQPTAGIKAGKWGLFVMCVAFILPGEYNTDWPGLDILPAPFFMFDSWDSRLEKHASVQREQLTVHHHLPWQIIWKQLK